MLLAKHRASFSLWLISANTSEVNAQQRDRGAHMGDMKSYDTVLVVLKFCVTVVSLNSILPLCHFVLSLLPYVIGWWVHSSSGLIGLFRTVSKRADSLQIET